MAIIREQIPEGLAIFDTEAKLRCGIVIDADGKVPYILSRPLNEELIQAIASRKDTIDNIDVHETKGFHTLNGQELRLTDSHLHDHSTDSAFTLKKLCNAWVDFDSEQESHATEPSVSADEFLKLFRKSDEHEEVLALLAQLADPEEHPAMRDVARIAIRGSQELMKKNLFDEELGLSKALRSHLFAYVKHLPKTTFEREK